jgi:hypothetical protein
MSSNKYFNVQVQMIQKFMYLVYVYIEQCMIAYLLNTNFSLKKIALITNAHDAELGINTARTHLTSTYGS